MCIPIELHFAYLFVGGDKTRKDNGHEAYLLAAANENERREWVRIIRKVIYAEKGGGTTLYYV